MNHRLAVAAGLVATWCLIVMAMGVQNAHTAWEWVWTFAFGTVVPVALLWQAGRVLAIYERSRAEPAHELRLIEALREGGELTAVLAAARSALPLDEVVSRLDALAARGHVDVRLHDGVEHYALAGAPSREARPRTPVDVSPSQPPPLQTHVKCPPQADVENPPAADHLGT
jgi:hypothetical protein